MSSCAAAVVFFAYSGFEAVANLGEETKNPKKDMPLGLLGTLGICTLLYMGVCLVITGMVKYTDLSEGDAVAQVFREVGLGWAGVLIGIAAVAGLSSVILVDMVAMGRIGFALARDGLLPPVVRARSTRRWNTPVPITALTVAVVARAGRLRAAGRRWPRWSASAPCSRSCVVSIAVPVLRRPSDRTWSGRSAPRCARCCRSCRRICCVLLMSNLAVETWLRFLVWLVLGLIIYVAYSRTHARLADPARFDALVTDERDVTGTPRD